MKQTYDVNVKAFKPLISPATIKEELPLTDDVANMVINGRRDVENILQKKDTRLLVIAGPCSIHDIDAALEYAHKMKQLREDVKEKINLIMRVYFEKPRTTIGWKGLINDPFLDASYKINEGLKKARSLLILQLVRPSIFLELIHKDIPPLSVQRGTLFRILSFGAVHTRIMTRFPWVKFRKSLKQKIFWML